MVPQVLIQNDGDGTLLRVTVQVGPRSAPGDVEEQIGDLFQRARGWIQSPLSVIAHRTVSALNRSRVEDPGSHRLPPRLT